MYMHMYMHMYATYLCMYMRMCMHIYILHSQDDVFEPERVDDFDGSPELPPATAYSVAEAIEEASRAGHRQRAGVPAADAAHRLGCRRVHIGSAACSSGHQQRAGVPAADAASSSGDRQLAGVPAAQDYGDEYACQALSTLEVVRTFGDEAPFIALSISFVAKENDDGLWWFAMYMKHFFRRNQQVQNLDAHVSLFKVRLDPARPSQETADRIVAFFDREVNKIEQRRGPFANDWTFQCIMNRDLSTDRYVRHDGLAGGVPRVRNLAKVVQRGSGDRRCTRPAVLPHQCGAQPHDVLRQAVSGGGMIPLMPL